MAEEGMWLGWKRIPSLYLVVINRCYLKLEGRKGGKKEGRKDKKREGKNRLFRNMEENKRF